MPTKTKIPYVDETINPIQDKIKGKSGRGYHCTKCSPGCLHCYAERINQRFGNHLPFDNRYILRQIEFELIQSELKKPLRWKKPRRIFVQSMGDLFHESVSFDFIHEVYGIIRQTPQHTYLLLTKRPERMKEVITLISKKEALGWAMGFYSHVWLGVTVCNADELWKIKELLSIPGFKKWVSVEPILEAVNLGKLSDPNISWVVAGCETGPGARPADNEWFRSLRDQCRAAGVPYFQKKCSGPTPDDLKVQEFPK